MFIQAWPTTFCHQVPIQPALASSELECLPWDLEVSNLAKLQQ